MIDYSKLNDEQLRIAEKVAAEAERQGVDPDFALGVAWAENRFRSKGVSTKGAVGPMQLMPKTAEWLGVNEKDEDQNIEGGVRYLNQLLKMDKIGGDKTKALIGYNAGPNSTFFKTGDPKDIPDETLNYIDTINTTLGGVLGRKEEANDDIPKIPEPPTVTEAGYPSTDYGSVLPAAGIGAAAGAGLGAAKMVTQGAARGATNAIANAVASQLPDRNARILQGTQDSGASGRARETGFNTRTAQNAAAEKEVARRLALLQQRGVVGQSASQVLANAPGMTASQHGVLYPSSVTPPPVPQAPIPQAPVPQPGTLERIGRTLAPVVNNPITRGALGAAGIAGSGMEFMNRMKSGDKPGMATTGMGALGSFLSMIPGANRVGLPMAAVGALGTAGLDAYRKAAREPAMLPEDFARAESLGVYAPLMQSLQEQEQEFKK